MVAAPRLVYVASLAALREGVRGRTVARGGQKALVGMGPHKVERQDCQGGKVEVTERWEYVRLPAARDAKSVRSERVFRGKHNAGECRSLQKS